MTNVVTSLPVRRLAPVALAAALALAGCGSSSENQSAPAAPTQAAATPPVATKPGAVSKDLSREPTIPKPTGQPPAQLVKRDIVKGKGPAAKAGDMLSVQYTGVAFSTGQKFDASWDRGAAPFQFPVGGGQVIRGWDKGIPGMRVGGRRELIIPAALAYGDQGSPPVIGPGQTLVFVVDLVKIG